jgi:hypothetical protein
MKQVKCKKTEGKKTNNSIEEMVQETRGKYGINRKVKRNRRRKDTRRNDANKILLLFMGALIYADR